MSLGDSEGRFRTVCHSQAPSCPPPLPCGWGGGAGRPPPSPVWCSRLHWHKFYWWRLLVPVDWDNWYCWDWGSVFTGIPSGILTKSRFVTSWDNSWVFYVFMFIEHLWLVYLIKLVYCSVQQLTTFSHIYRTYMGRLTLMVISPKFLKFCPSLCPLCGLFNHIWSLFKDFILTLR